jgi:eukaryotic-like serine/threonine-protein kinase
VSIDGPLLLAGDIQIVPVRQLEPATRARMNASDDDYVISRPRSRLPTSVIDPDSAELLANFREPTRIVDAILAFAKCRDRDPKATLEAAYPVLSRLVHTRWLVPPERAPVGPPAGALHVGNTLWGFRLIRPVQERDDNQVFLARDGSGRYAAVKFSPNSHRSLCRRLVQEARLLRRVRCGRTPAVVGLSRDSLGVALATEWVFGLDAERASSLLRDARRDEPALLALCVEIATAYADAHESGVLHGDIHPHNVLIEASGRARLIDFGLGQDVVKPHCEAVMAVAPFFLTPETAGALRARQRVAPSAAGEQYAVAALLYQVWTGVHYLDWNLEREAMLRQIVEDEPIGFEQRRVLAWPELEGILRRALDKNPAARFENLRSVANALSALLPVAQQRARRVSPPCVGSRVGDRLNDVLERYAPRGEVARKGLAEAPFASVSYGAGGIAYALLKVAQHRNDPQLLAAADLWAQKAYAMTAREDAFYNPALQVERATVGAISLFHSESGLHCVRALVSAAQADSDSANRAIAAFASHAQRPYAGHDPLGSIDVTRGEAGLLLGCAELVESIQDLPGFDLGAVRASGEGIAGHLAALLQAETIESSSLTSLGIAHGWAGLIFALLRWAHATQGNPEAALRVRLEELAILAEPNGTGLRWPVRTDSSTFMDGWCNGAAGYAMLYALAYSVLREARFAVIAEQAAISAHLGATTNGSLCCGQGGIGYGLLTLHRLTGDTVWLQRARSAARQAEVYGLKQLPRDALYQGALGVALLTDDLNDAAGGAMPLFEPVV